MTFRRRTAAVFATVVWLLVGGCGSAEQSSDASSLGSVGEDTRQSSTTTLTTAPSTTVSSTTGPSTTGPSPTALDTITPVRTGAEVLAANDFSLLDGRRVGLISHQNSTVDGVHLADLLADADNVELVALFGPEHGARGDRDAGAYVPDFVDSRTGVTVYSLYGETRQPTDEMLAGLDVLVFDLQDVGARYYTYVSTMGLAMQAAARAGIDFVVLDRPNPLGGRVAGGVLDPPAASFVGLYPIPDTHGLTAGELAQAIVANGWLEDVEGLRLEVVPLSGWDASMRWHQTGLPWIAPSPALTTPDSALVYPATVYLEATSVSYGRGTDRPFTSFGAPWLDAEAVTSVLEARDLPGIRFLPTSASPEMLPGMTVEPAYLGENIPMIEIDVVDPAAVRPVELGVHLLDVLSMAAAEADIELLDRPQWLDQLSGSDRLRDELARGMSASAIIERQRIEAATLSKELERHHLYARSG